MRKLVLVLAAVLLASLGALTPAAAARRLGRHRHQGRDHRRGHGQRHAELPLDADQIYAEAIKYTTNVVRVYSPNATWAKVKAAVNGASIVVYLGHGNGWPSPYAYDPAYTTKDGFGLNDDLNGDGKLTDYENKYYGEPSIRTLTPAPNAVVLLFHLCYASGNSEPGGTAPSAGGREAARRQLRGRIPRGGRPRRHRHRPQPRPVLHPGAVHDPPDDRAVLADAPDCQRPRAVVRLRRSPGYTYRWIRTRPRRPASTARSTGKMCLTTERGHRRQLRRHRRDPATMVVPGNASPLVDGAPVYGSAATTR